MGIENIGNNLKPAEKVPQRLWLANEVNLKMIVKDVKVSGKENLEAIPKDAKVVIMTTHMTDFDIPVAIHTLAKDLNIVVMNGDILRKQFLISSITNNG